MTDLTFQGSAWDEYVWWQGQDRRTLRRINDLLKAIRRDPRQGLGQPEELRGQFAGAWSRRIDEQNRIIYEIGDDTISIVACRGHYRDR